MRLVKGIYLEPEDIAYQGMPEINANFLRLLEQLVDLGSYVGIATPRPRAGRGRARR